MAQSAERKGGGKSLLIILSFWNARTPEPSTYWEEWIMKFHWGMIAKYDDFYFANTLDETVIAALPGEVHGKNRIDAKKKLKSNLYLCIRDEAQRLFNARKPAVNIKTERYPRVLDEMQNVFKRERNVTHERGLFYGRKQREKETFEKFHEELSGLAEGVILLTLPRIFVISYYYEHAWIWLSKRIVGLPSYQRRYIG